MKDHRRTKPASPEASEAVEQKSRPSKQRMDELLDEALKGTFPASDPIALTPRPRA